MDTPEGTGTTPVDTGTEQSPQPLEPSPFSKRVVEVFFSSRPSRVIRTGRRRSCSAPCSPSSRYS